MLSGQPEAYKNGNSSEATPIIPEAKIQQLLENEPINQPDNVNEFSSGLNLKNGRYIIQKKLSQGGFADIYLAQDIRDNQNVVIKITKKELQNQDNFEENFVKEAIYLAICKHTHIVQYKNIFKTHKDWCLVMEYIEGEDLYSWVRKNGYLSETDALLYIRQIGNALILIHEHGLLHRDVKPKNIIRTTDGSKAILIDFGIARWFDSNRVEQHTPFLTEKFAPIEQYIERYKRGAFTDVYALAATLYYLLTGIEPISSLSRREGDELVRPIEILGKENISIEVNNAIILGMQIHPGERPQTIQDWLKLLPNSQEEESIEKFEQSLETKLSTAISENDKSNLTENQESNSAYLPTKPPNNYNHNGQISNWIPALSSSTSFLLTLAIVSFFTTTLIRTGFWLLLAIIVIFISVFIAKEYNRKQKIGLIISSLIPSILIFTIFDLFIPSLKNWLISSLHTWKFEGWELVSLGLLIFLTSLLGFAIMNFFQEDS
ncbi:serine/threonine protein kinase [Mastigocladus laminosus UU774]|nr:serine/threonine protein kinase [Mastigocladus laminosus UU774]